MYSQFSSKSLINDINVYFELVNIINFELTVTDKKNIRLKHKKGSGHPVQVFCFFPSITFLDYPIHFSAFKSRLIMNCDSIDYVIQCD